MSKAGGERWYDDPVITYVLSSRDVEATIERYYGELDSDRCCGSNGLYVNE